MLPRRGAVCGAGTVVAAVGWEAEGRGLRSRGVGGGPTPPGARLPFASRTSSAVASRLSSRGGGTNERASHGYGRCASASGQRKEPRSGPLAPPEGQTPPRPAQAPPRDPHGGTEAEGEAPGQGVQGSPGLGPGPWRLPWGDPTRPAGRLHNAHRYDAKGFLNAFLRTLFPTTESRGQIHHGPCWSRSHPVGSTALCPSPSPPGKPKPVVSSGFTYHQPRGRQSCRQTRPPGPSKYPQRPCHPPETPAPAPAPPPNHSGASLFTQHLLKMTVCQAVRKGQRGEQAPALEEPTWGGGGGAPVTAPRNQCHGTVTTESRKGRPCLGERAWA